jgi:GxxExxY protein
MPQESFFVDWRTGADSLSRRIIAGAMKVHRLLGPGLAESAYEDCLCLELTLLDIPFERRVEGRTIFGMRLFRDYAPDLVVDKRVIVELKTAVKILPAHEAQIVDYMDDSAVEAGLLINFSAPQIEAAISYYRRPAGLATADLFERSPPMRA